MSANLVKTVDSCTRDHSMPVWYVDFADIQAIEITDDDDKKLIELWDTTYYKYKFVTSAGVIDTFVYIDGDRNPDWYNFVRKYNISYNAVYNVFAWWENTSEPISEQGLTGYIDTTETTISNLKQELKAKDDRMQKLEDMFAQFSQEIKSNYAQLAQDMQAKDQKIKELEFKLSMMELDA